MDATGWVWPTDQDQRLFAAKQDNDIGAYCAVLAGLDVYVACRLDDAEDYLAGRRQGLTRYVTSAGQGRTHVDVHTRGALPASRPDGVYFDHTMWAGFVEDLAKSEPDWILAVNRGTAIEAYLSVREVGNWLRANPQTVGSWDALRNTVRTLRNEPSDGDLARALACGAHLSVMNGLPWNTMGADRLDFQNDRVMLRDWWGVENVEDWHKIVNSLLDTASLDAIDLVLALRREGAGGLTPSSAPASSSASFSDPAPAPSPSRAPSPDPAALVAGVHAWCQGRDVPQDTVTELVDIAGWIGACEGWLRRDGILPYGGMVHSQAAWDLGRAVNMGRWGLTCGFCDRDTAERIVRHAGALCAQTYPTWTDLSAGYIVGRVVMMGRQGSPERTYEESLRIHSALMRDTTSPWRTLALR